MSWEVPGTPQHASCAPARVRSAGDIAPVVGPRCLMTFSSLPDCERITVTVRGEVDLNARELVRDNLISALDVSEHGINVHLGGVSFWDCSALNALLAARQHAASEGKTLALDAASSIVRRVLELTTTARFFTGLFAGPAEK